MATESEFIGDGRPDGVIIGRSSTELVGFYGVTTAVAQAATIAAVTTTAATLTVYGFTTTAQFNALIANVNSIRTALINLGIIAA